MAKPEILKIKKGVIYFTLSNKSDLVCKINTDDFEKFLKGSLRWYIHKSKTHNSYYIRRNNYPKHNHVHLHREILGLGDHHGESVVDHKDRNGLNNIKNNLKHTNHIGNMQNRARPAKRKYKGISITKVVKNGVVSYRARDGVKYFCHGTTLKKLKERISEKLKESTLN